ncbi:unnamed protein product [Oreochromis niloticus]|nr:unnamed protein product [Mustela putorius furo]
MIQRRQKYWLNWLTPGSVPHSCPRTFKTQRRADRRSVGSFWALQMKMFGRMMSCCVALLLTFSSVSAVRRALDSITDLRSVGFGQSVPEHSLCLLHWFANEIGINGDISLTFDPNSYDYGSHHYRNNEQLLDPVPWGYQYYSLGNIHRQGSLRLPHHVIQSEHEYGNRARIIIRVREQNVGWQTSRIIDRVYITQHYGTSEHRGSAYDPQHTYQVTTNLLTELRSFPLDHDNINLQSLRVFQENYSSQEYNNRQSAIRSNAQNDVVINFSERSQNDAFVFPKRYNSNLNVTSQDDNTCDYSSVCAVLIVALLIFGFLYLSYSSK